VSAPSAKVHRFVAESDDARDRLDKFVVDRLAAAGDSASRSQIQRWIRAGRVTVAGKSADASDAVGVGAIVEVYPLPPEPTELEPDPSVVFDVLFEDEHLILVDKPGGLVVHPGRGHAEKTLVHGLLARGAFPKSIDLLVDRVPRAVREARGERASAESDRLASVRPGIVHRIDKGTSGILVVAKNERAREGLKTQFARHEIERAYLAIVVGQAKDATFETLHGRHPTDRVRFTTRVTEGRRAVTRVRVVEHLGPRHLARATLVECRLETGRTHQIRVHLSECAATPILGDPLYGREPHDPLLKEVGRDLGRQALHAAVLGFVHPVTEEKLRFERPPPADFAKALAALR
jgi:23S rRNA pseudouridine1911/1915/1917 synthase